MSRYIGTLIFLLFAGILPSQGQRDIKGSGYVLTQQRETSYFSSIEVAGKISVYISPGEFLPITIEADDNLFPYIKTVVRDDILKIYLSDTVNIVKFADMNVLIGMPKVSRLMARQFGYIEGSMSTWDVDTVKIRVASAGRIKLAAKASYIDAKAKTSAIIELKGKTKELEAELTTAARLDARELEADEADIDLGTGAKAEIRVNHELEYNLGGSSRLIYKGNPRILQAKTTAGSKVIHDR